MLWVYILIIIINRTGLYPQFYPDEMCRKSATLVQHNPPLLYNLNHDPGELNPLNATQFPYKEIVNEIDKVSSFKNLFTYVVASWIPENACTYVRSCEYHMKQKVLYKKLQLDSIKYLNCLRYSSLG